MMRDAISELSFALCSISRGALDAEQSLKVRCRLAVLAILIAEIIFGACPED